MMTSKRGRRGNVKWKQSGPRKAFFKKQDMCSCSQTHEKLAAERARAAMFTPGRSKGFSSLKTLDTGIKANFRDEKNWWNLG